MESYKKIAEAIVPWKNISDQEKNDRLHDWGIVNNSIF